MFHRKLDLLFQFILYIAALYCLLALDANLNLPTLTHNSLITFSEETPCVGAHYPKM